MKPFIKSRDVCQCNRKKKKERNALKLNVAMNEALSVRNHEVYIFSMGKHKKKKVFEMKKAKSSKINTSEKYSGAV